MPLARALVSPWSRRVTAWFGCVWMSSCLGGQSGGETGLQSSQADTPRACACIDARLLPVRAEVTRREGGCAELVVLELLEPTPPDTYLPLAVGDAFGGVLAELCAGSPEVNTGDEVLALFSRGTQDSSGCREYRTCSVDRCGDLDAAYTTTTDPECEAERAANPNVDCKPILEVDEDALVAYDQCDTTCLEETREACATHAAETQLGGTVVVAPWHDGEVSFFWAGETRSEPYAALTEDSCTGRHQQWWLDSRNAHPPESTPQQDVAAPAPDQPAAAQCPLPTPQ